MPTIIRKTIEGYSNYFDFITCHAMILVQSFWNTNDKSVF